MIRKLFIRTLRVFAVIVCVCILGAAVSAFLAFREPSFYATIEPQAHPDASIEADLEQAFQELEAWVLRRPIDNNRDEKLPETYNFCITEAQLNCMFVTDRFRAGDVGIPRVKLLEGTMQLGSEVRLGDTSLIVSADLRPTLTNTDSLRLEIRNARVGSLPFPLHSVLSFFSKHGKLKDDKVQLDLSGPAPILEFTIPHQRHKNVVVKSVTCRTGELIVEFGRSNKVADARPDSMVAR